jgi:hypothetical protein
MKSLKRLAAAADFRNHPDGYLVMDLRESDGGDFELHPRVDEKMIYLPSTDAPGYRVAIMGENPDVLDRLGRALQALARSQRGADPDDES